MQLTVDMKTGKVIDEKSWPALPADITTLAAWKAYRDVQTAESNIWVAVCAAGAGALIPVVDELPIVSRIMKAGITGGTVEPHFTAFALLIFALSVVLII